MAQGNYTAYSQLKPITTDFGKMARQEEALQFKYREEERAAKAQAQEVKDNIAESFQTDYASIEDVVTNTKSIDEAFVRGVNSARDHIGSIYRDINRDPSLMDDVETQMKLRNLTNYSKNLKLFSDRYTDYAKTISAGMQDGSLSSWNSNTLGTMDGIFRKADLAVDVDPKTGLPIAVIRNSETGKLEEVDMVKALDGRGITEVVPTYNLSENALALGEKLGERLDSIQSGYTTIEEQKFDKIEEDVRGLVRGVIGSAGNPNDAAKAIWADYMGNPAKKLNEADMKQIEDFYVSAIKPFYDEKYQKAFDSDAWLKQRGQDMKGTDSDAEEFTTPEFVPDTDTGQPIVKTIETSDGKSLETNVVSFGDGMGVTVLDTEGRKEHVANIYISDDGEVYADMIVEEKKIGEPVRLPNGDLNVMETVFTKSTKGWSAGETDKPIKLTPTQFNNLAKNSDLRDDNGKRFKDAKAFRDYLKKKKGSTSGAFDDL